MPSSYAEEAPAPALPSAPPAAAPTHRELLRDGTLTLVTRLIALFGAIVMSAATARLLGAAGRGIYAIPTIDASIATSFFGGLTSVTTYFIASKGAGRGAMRAIGVAAMLFVAIGTAAVVVLGLIGHHLWATLPAAAALPFSAINSICIGFAYGVKRIWLASVLGITGVVAVVVITLGGFFLGARTPGMAIAGWIGSLVVVTIVAFVIFARYVPSLPKDNVRSGDAFAFAMRIGAVNVVTMLNLRADVYIIALFTTPTVLGMYTLAVAGAEAALMATTALTAAAAPHIASLALEESRRLAASAARNVIALGALTCVVLAIIAPYAVAIVFGPAFAPVAHTLRILLIGIVAVSAGGIFSTYFTLRRGRPEVALYIAGGSAALCIVVTLLLVPHYGMNGAAMGTVVSYVLSAATMIAMFKRDSRLPLREIVVLTRGDLTSYRGFAIRLLRRAGIRVGAA